MVAQLRRLAHSVNSSTTSTRPTELQCHINEYCWIFSQRPRNFIKMFSHFLSVFYLILPASALPPSILFRGAPSRSIARLLNRHRYKKTCQESTGKFRHARRASSPDMATQDNFQYFTLDDSVPLARNTQASSPHRMPSFPPSDYTKGHFKQILHVLSRRYAA